MPINPGADITLAMGIDAKEMYRTLNKTQAVLRKNYGAAMEAATKAAFAKRNLKSLGDSFRSAGNELSKIQLQTQKNLERLRIQGLDNEERLRIASELKILQQRSRALKDESRKRMKMAKDSAKAWVKETEKLKVAAECRKAFTDEWSKGAGSRGREGMSKFLEGIFSGDVKGLMSSGKMAAKYGGKKAMDMAGSDLGRKMGGGKALEALGSLGGTLAKLTTVMMAVGAVAGALAVLVQVFLEADKLVKEMNSSLLKSNVAAADLGGNWLNLEDRLEEVRDSFNKFSFMSAWKVLPKESLQIVDAFGAAGLKVSQFTAGLEEAADRQQKLRDVTETALVYANLTGMTGTEVATKMGEYMDNLAMSLDSVREGFSGIYRVANESGYSTKKFFGMVLQATSGLTMYNVRLEQTAGLLKELTSALGLKDGFELLQRILGQMKGKSVEQGAKDIIASKGGEALARQQARTDILYKLGNFLERAGKNPETMMKLEDAARAAGVKMDFSSPEKMLKSLLGLSGDDFRKFGFEFGRRAEGNKEQMDLFRGLREDFKHFLPALRGDAVNIAGAQGRGSPVFQLLRMMAQLSGAAGLAGQKAVDIKGYGLLAAEKLGIDNDTAQKLSSLMSDLTGNFRGMQDEAAKITDKSQITEEMNRHFAKTQGMALKWNEETKKAEVVRATVSKTGAMTLGRTIGNLSDWLYSNEEMIKKAMGSGESQDILLAKAVAANTNEATKILRGIKDMALLDILMGVRRIIEYMKSDQTSEASKMIQEGMRVAVRGTQGQLRAIQAEKTTVSGMLPNATPEERKVLQKRMEELEEDESLYQRQLKALTDRMTFLGDMAIREPEKFKEKFVDPVGASTQWEGGGDLGNLDPESRKRMMKLALGQKIYGEGSTDANAAAKDIGLTGMRIYGVSVGEEGEVGFSTELPASVREAQLARSRLEDKAERQLKETKEARAEALKKVPKVIAEENDKLARQREIDTLAAQMGVALPNMGYTDRGDLARRLMAGGEDPTLMKYLKENPELAKKFLGIEGLPPEARAKIEQALRGSKADDLGMIVGDGRVKMAQRIDRRDQMLAFAREGGALSKGGGGVTNVQNNFWEGKGAFNSMRQLEKAKGRFA